MDSCKPFIHLEKLHQIRPIPPFLQARRLRVSQNYDTNSTLLRETTPLRKTVVLDFGPEVEIPPFSACAETTICEPAIKILAVFFDSASPQFHKKKYFID